MYTLITSLTIKGVPVADLIPSQGVDFPIAIEKRSEVKHALDEPHD